MALSFVLQATKYPLHNSVVINDLFSIVRACGAYMQVREKKSRFTPNCRFRRTPFHAKWWPKREHKYYDENLTKDNKDFIQEVIKEKYLQPGESPLKEVVQWERGEWEPGSRRAGVIARKIGVYPVWTKGGKRLLTTLLQVVDNHVIKYHPPEEFSKISPEEKYRRQAKYGSLIVGAESADPQLFTAEYNGLFTASGVMPKRKLSRFLVTPNAALPPGTPLYVSHFSVGDYVDVMGKTIEHGFQGVVKRWGMKGGPASHGCTKTHRKMGSAAGGKQRGLWKGKRMPGHMGGATRWLCGLKIWRINTKYNVMWVQGPAIPGDINSYIRIVDSTLVKHRKTEESTLPPFPTHFPEEDKEPLPEDLYDKELHVFSDPTITFDQAAVSK